MASSGDVALSNTATATAAVETGASSASFMTPSPTTFATSVVSATRAATTRAASLSASSASRSAWWEDDRSSTAYRPLYTYTPTYYTSSSSSSSSSNSNSSGGPRLNQWVAALIGVGSALVLGFIIVASIKYCKYRIQKREFKAAQASDPSLDWTRFRQDWNKRMREAALAADAEEALEEAQQRQAWRDQRQQRKDRNAQKKAAKQAAKAAKKGKTPDGVDVGLLGSDVPGTENREPPPYSAAMDTETERGMKPW